MSRAGAAPRECSFLAPSPALPYTKNMARTRLVLILAVVLGLRATPAAADPAAAGGAHLVAAGETLSGIAAHYGMTLADVLERNPGIDPDRIRIGQRIELGDDQRYFDYRIRWGDTLSGIAKRHEVSLAEIVRWNPGLEPDRIREGDTLRMRGLPATSFSKSIGTPSDGELVDGRLLPRHRAYVLRERARAWGTDETVRGIVKAFDALLERHPKAPKARVHDLSLKRGGPMDDHRSHQSGRDVDISYFHEACRGGGCDFRRLGPGQLDVERTWSLLHYWLERDMLEAVFIDYRLQAPLYRHARSRGATRAELHRWFQYPRGRTSPLGVVRHVSNHADHMHVRFACDQSDPECKTFRPVLMKNLAKR
jgi:LysM repeat protein